MLKREVKSLLVNLCGVVGLSTLISMPAFADAVTLRGASVFSQNVAQSGVSIDLWAKAVNERSNGEISVNVVHGGSLLNTRDHVDGIRTGLVDVMVVYPFYFPGDFKVDGALTNITDIWSERTPDLTALSRLQLELVEEFDEFAAEYRSRNLMALTPVPIDPYVFACTKEAKSIDDLKGRKIRVFGRYLPLLIGGLEAQTVTIPGSEVYSALSTGLVECIYSSPDYLLGQSIQEVAPHILVTAPEVSRPQASPTGVLAMNINSFNKLSAEHQEIILSVSEEMVSEFGALMSRVYHKALDGLVEKGNGSLNHLSEKDLEAWRERVPNLFEQAAKDLDAEGLPGSKIMARYRELIDEFTR